MEKLGKKDIDIRDTVKLGSNIEKGIDTKEIIEGEEHKHAVDVAETEMVLKADIVKTEQLGEEDTDIVKVKIKKEVTSEDFEDIFNAEIEAQEADIVKTEQLAEENMNIGIVKVEIEVDESIDSEDMIKAGIEAQEAAIVKTEIKEEEGTYIVEVGEIEIVAVAPAVVRTETEDRKENKQSTKEENIEPSTSRTALGSGMSTMSHEIDVNIERELIEPDDSDSEIEVDEVDNDLVDSLRTRNVFEYPAIIDDLDDPILSMEVQNLGAEDDVGLRALADPDDGDLLYFDWRGDVNNFKGVREIFTGPSGPTFDVMGLTPLEILKKIWDTDFIDHIVRETNRYAHQTRDKTAAKVNSRMSRWKDTTENEIWRFLTIIMLQSLVVNDVEREYWYPSNDQLKIGAFDKIMSYNRFILLKRCLHFVDNTAMPEKTSKLDKVMPIIQHLNKKFSSLYLPEQNVAIDESLLLWKGRLSFAQLIATKRAKVGIKSYELCESRTGYLWRMEIYSGKGHVHVPQEEPQEATEGHGLGNEPDSATSQIVFNLMRPLFGKGHTLVMDNFYNAPLLSRLLKTNHRTDTMGTLRLNREFVPESLKIKNKKNMKAGEVCFSSTEDLSVVVWKDKNVVAMISTFHHPEVGGKEKYGYYKYKPQVVLDYNLSMGGVDHKDQMLHAFPVERVRNMCWYKKLFRRLLNVSIHNALVIYNHDRTKLTEFGNRQFRLQLVLEMLQTYSPEALKLQQTPITLSQMHLPAKNLKVQRCKLCAEAKVRRTTIWRCSTCDVNLCIEGCYTSYHAKYV